MSNTPYLKCELRHFRLTTSLPRLRVQQSALGNHYEAWEAYIFVCSKCLSLGPFNKSLWLWWSCGCIGLRSSRDTSWVVIWCIWNNKIGNCYCFFKTPLYLTKQTALEVGWFGTFNVTIRQWSTPWWNKIKNLDIGSRPNHPLLRLNYIVYTLLGTSGNRWQWFAIRI